ncbi:Mannose-6-phosphate isomerase, cupin superfamily [Fontibacillus panacisegetis]|uniref:Mannose-6-phosphate isomerase, cupin superfamily n=1 Tax=Fontibacillus panacisegetis TaxID=670482 RepID=A0A1G7E5V5_9BACL|nr:cupin domain-containing protein [Fontibacillus panacisegetis]SDE58860.1 Mannose-6-phosphate isomerase, cupin superfamily [Fontibacillus panacisegetis]
MYRNGCYYDQWHHPMYDYCAANWNRNSGPYYCGQLYYRKSHNESIKLMDYGPNPFVVNIEEAAEQNNTYRTTLWTGEHFQVTLMSINAGDDIGLEVHPDTDQFIRIEEGQGLIQIGDSKDKLNFQAMAYDGYAIMIPAGKWHNVTNTGRSPLKVYVIYAPPHHPHGTVHKTKADAMTSET